MAFKFGGEVQCEVDWLCTELARLSPKGRQPITAQKPLHLQQNLQGAHSKGMLSSEDGWAFGAVMGCLPSEEAGKSLKAHHIFYTSASSVVPMTLPFVGT